VKVALTGTRPRPLADRLRAAGFDVVHCPLVRVESLGDAPVRAEGYDWVVVTSRNGVECLFARLEGALPQVAAIGPGTADALRARGVEPALVPSRSTQEGLAAEVPRPTGRVLFAGAEGARDVLSRELGADFLPLYRTIEIHPPDFPDADIVVVASPSAARALAVVRRGALCVAIGPITAEELRTLGLRVAAEASAPTPDEVTQAVKLAASRSVSSRS
jgi:uroporphyrinogen III methyltransferase / synthase